MTDGRDAVQFEPRACLSACNKKQAPKNSLNTKQGISSIPHLALVRWFARGQCGSAGRLAFETAPGPQTGSGYEQSLDSVLRQGV